MSDVCRFSVTATCDPVRKNYVLNGVTLDQVYCSQQPPTPTNAFSSRGKRATRRV